MSCRKQADITARVAENDREIIAGLEANIAELEKLQEESVKETEQKIIAFKK